MSLVNDMLRDLEKRKASEEANSPATGASRESMIEPQSKRFSTKDISLLIMLVLIVLLVAYILMKGETQDSLTGEQSHTPVEISSQEDLPSSTDVEKKELPESPTEVAKLPASKPVIEKKTEQSNTSTKSDSPKKSKPVEKVVKREKAKSPAPSIQASQASRESTKHRHKENSRKEHSHKEELVSSVKQASVAKPKQAEPEKVIAEQSLASSDEIQNSEQEVKAKPAGLTVVLSPSARDLKTASDAISLFEVGKPEEAYNLMEDFVVSHQTIEKTLRVLANRLLLDQRFQELQQLFERAGEPLEPGLRQVKARWLLIGGQPELAIVLLEQLQPNIEVLPEYYALLASLYQRSGQAGKAFETYSQLIQSNDTVADWWAGLGVAADQLQQPRQAMFAYQQAISLPALNGALEQYIRQRMNALSTEK